MRIAVFDTNVWLSGLVFGGRCRTLLEGILDRQYVVVISEPLISEMGDVLAGPKFRYSQEAVAAIQQDARGMARVVHPAVTVRAVPDDPDDDRVLECALAGEAQRIVTGDRHLLKMGVFRGIRIVDPAAFMREIQHPGQDPWGAPPDEAGSGKPLGVNETGSRYRAGRKGSRAMATKTK